MNLIKKIIRELFRKKITKSFINSEKYWDDRYSYGGNSGSGSYGNDAQQKANFLNNILLKYNLDTVIDIGCGDGNNLKFFKPKNYIGIDVSETIIKKNISKFKYIDNYEFFVLKNNFSNILNYIDHLIRNHALLVVSFDVIFHLIEDDKYNDHINFINNINANYCLICSSDINIEYDDSTLHVRHRKYSTDLMNLGWNTIIQYELPNDRDNRVIKLFFRGNKVLQ